MLLFIESPALVSPWYWNFNTSHVTVYQSARLSVPVSVQISIHLMLLFIPPTPSQTDLYPSDFNTSHVTVYLIHDTWICSVVLISIHLMLLFIRVHSVRISLYFIFQYISCYCLSATEGTTFVDKYWFQYISCYCLSSSFVHSAFRKSNFNTSHVTVYPRRRHTESFSLRFQYISCYCLSACPDVVLEVAYSFQYISCYCLSFFSFVDMVKSAYFNTSHVTVYHLATHELFAFAAFQYISCYCLSIM